MSKLKIRSEINLSDAPARRVLDAFSSPLFDSLQSDKNGWSLFYHCENSIEVKWCSHLDTLIQWFVDFVELEQAK